MAQEGRRSLKASHRRGRSLLVLGGVMVAAHLLALSGLQWAWPQPDMAPLAARVMAVRELPPAKAVTPPGLVEQMVAIGSDEPAPSSPPAAPARPARRAPVVRPAAARVVAEPTPPFDASVPSTPLAPDTAESTDDSLAQYRTLTPPPLTLRYQVRHGPAGGSGELRWRPTADRYELALDIDVGGSAALIQLSQGGFDGAGLAPLRFTDKRSRRPAAAANFQRDAGMITFSGPATRYPLLPGSQDRLSWLLQLPAIVAAEPSLRDAGSKVVMNVATANGDVAVWVFRCQGLDATDGAAAVLVYRREARGPYDTAVSVSLDPQQGYLPLRASWKSGVADAGFDLSLQEITPYP